MKPTANQTAYLIKLYNGEQPLAVGRMRQALRNAKLITYGKPYPNGVLPETLTGLGRMWVKAQIAKRS